MLAKQGGLKLVFDQPLARPGDRVDTGLQRRRDLAIAPARTTLRGVSFQQDAGLQQLLCRMFPAMDKGGELLSFLIAECHDVLLYRDLFSGHEPAPSLVTEASRQKIDVESMTDTTRLFCPEPVRDLRYFGDRVLSLPLAPRSFASRRKDFTPP